MTAKLGWSWTVVLGILYDSSKKGFHFGGLSGADTSRLPGDIPLVCS